VEVEVGDSMMEEAEYVRCGESWEGRGCLPLRLENHQRETYGVGREGVEVEVGDSIMEEAGYVRCGKRWEGRGCLPLRLQNLTISNRQLRGI
jgi:hypothetical protein